MTMKVSLVQYDIAFGNPKENHKRVELLIEKAMKDRPDIILLPELWTTGYDLSRLSEIVDEHAQTDLMFMKKMAQKHQIHIIAGSLANKDNNKIFNTLFVVNSKGEILHEYSKAHLFRLMNEEKFLHAGSKKGLFNLNHVRCAGVVCYDIRFPEWIRAHALAGAEVLFVTAEWPKPRIDHWRSLLISRAIENQCYVIACNRIGADPDNEFGGHSMVIDPWGKVIKEAGEEETILTTAIDVKQVAEIRRQIPIFEDRRTDLY